MWPTHQLHEQITKTLTNMYTNGARHIYPLRNIRLNKSDPSFSPNTCHNYNFPLNTSIYLLRTARSVLSLSWNSMTMFVNVNTHQHFIKKSVCNCRTYLHTKFNLPAFNHWLHITETWNLNLHLAQLWCFPFSILQIHPCVPTQAKTFSVRKANLLTFLPAVTL